MTERPDPKALIDSVKDDAIGMVKNVIALAKAEVTPRAKTAGIMGGMFGGAGYLGLNGVSLLFLAGAAGFGALFNRWLGVFGSAALGLVAMAIVLFIIAAIMALIGKSKIPALTKPLETPEIAQHAIDTAKGGIEVGQEKVDAELEESKQPALQS